MTLVLVEDDDEFCEKFKAYVKSRDDVIFVGVTNSSDEGIEIVKRERPDGIVLDLELTKGQGTGAAFLRGIKNIPKKPLIVLNTNTQAELLHHAARTMGAALVFYKRQKGYSFAQVIDEMLFIHTANMDGQSESGDIPPGETVEEKYEKIRESINAELDLVGINSKYKGRAYLLEAIFLLAINKDGASESALNKVAENEGVNYSSVIRAMQTVIGNAWYGSNPETLSLHYKEKVDVRLGKPTPSEFVHYYANKIKKAPLVKDN